MSDFTFFFKFYDENYVCYLKYVYNYHCLVMRKLVENKYNRLITKMYVLVDLSKEAMVHSLVFQETTKSQELEDR